MKAKRFFFPLALTLACTCNARAVEYTWDSNGTTAGIQTGGGNWATTATNWTTDGGTNRVGWLNSGTDSAYFQGPISADITVRLNSADIQVDDVRTGTSSNFIYLNQIDSSSTIRTLTLTGGTYDGTGTTGSQFNINTGGNLSITGTLGTSQFRLTGTADLVKTGGGSLFITSRNHDFTGNIHVKQGNLFVNSGSDTSLGNADNDITLDGGTLNLQTNALVLGSGRTITLGAGGGRIGGNMSLTLQGTVMGTGSLEKINSGEVNLTTVSSYAGTTTITAGALRLQANGTIPSTSNVTINGSTSIFNIRNTIGWFYNGTITGNDLGSLNFTNGTNATLAGNISGVASITANHSGTNATISGAISGVANVNVLSAGATLRLSGTNSQTGTTTITGGTLILDYGTNNNSKLSDSASLTLNGGTLQLDGGSHTETVASTTLSAGTYSEVSRSSGSSLLQMNAITVNAGSAVNFSASGIATTDNTNSNGILGTWATIGGTDFATNQTDGPDGLIVAYAGYTDVTRLSSGTKVIADGATSNIRIIEGSGSAGDITLGAATTNINTLTQSASGGTSAATINQGGQTLTVGSILSSDGAGSLTLANGTLTATTAGGELALVNHAVNPLVITSAIADNTSPSTLATAGPGTTRLGGANTFSGNATIHEGTLEITGTGQLGAGNYAGAIANKSALIYSSTAAQTLSGVISGNGSLTKTNTSTLTLGGANTFSGQLTVAEGTLSIDAINNVSANGRLGNSALPVILGGSGTAGTLQYTGAAATSTKPFTLATGGTGVLDVTTEALTLSGVIDGSGALVKTGAGPLILSGGNTFSGGFTNNGTGNINSAEAAGTNSCFGTGPVVMNAGTLYFTNDWTFANALTLNGASLRIGGASNRLLTWSGPVNVTANSTIQADGGTTGVTISGAVTLSSGATLTSIGGGTVNAISGTIGGTGNLTVDSGLLELNGAGSYSGSTTLLNASTLRLLANGTLPAAGNLVINGTANLNVRNTIGWVHSGTISGEGTGSINLNTGTNATLAGDISGVLNINANTTGTNATISGDISGPANITVQSGGGTLTLSGTNSYTGTTSVLGGSLVVAVDDCLPDSTNVTIGNGMLTLSADVNDTVGTLDVTNAASTIDLAAGATLAFAASNAVDWTDSPGTLNITGTFVSGSSLRFGTDANGLTAGQLGQITAAGFTNFALDASGYLTATPNGTPYGNWALQITDPDLRDRADDADGDGFTNLQEFLFGSSPIAGNGALVTTTASGGNLTLRWLQRESGATYTLKQSPSLAIGSWTNVASPVPALDANQSGAPTDYDYHTVTLPASSSTMFFRIEGVEN